ncbi:MAG: hypothetical protein ABR497_02145 [Kiritimatiellia bacterium]|nr:hypothetical protein [Lentisphaerota bacterium]
MPNTPETNLALLDNFDLDIRLKALQQARTGAGLMPPPAGAPRTNMHLHSFFSFNTNGSSPCRLAWEAATAGLFAAGLCDFDVLDGLEEFLAAGTILHLRVTANLETRAFFREYAELDVNSPGEPGVTYIMGGGFARVPDPATEAGRVLAQYRQQAQARNHTLVERINRALPEIALDYDRQVVPLTPAGAPTERHIVRAYRRQAQQVFPDEAAHRQFWSRIAGQPAAQLSDRLASTAAMEEFIRALLIKSGGIAYEQPGPHSFPPVDDFINWVRDCGALPMITWLDGTSAGESDAAAMLECLRAKGACALNIIPDRNHNIADPDLRSRKIAKLDEIVQLAAAMHLPVQIGTEMNKAGQPFVDDPDCEALRTHAPQFLSGAAIMVGHTILARYAEFPYNSAAARVEFGGDLRRRNAFFEAVGHLPAPDTVLAQKLADAGPERAMNLIRDAVQQGCWTG